jgi:hypothetical protein
MKSITAMSSRHWIDLHPLKLDRYLRRHHRPEDRPLVFSLLYDSYPDEGKKLVENFSLTDARKKLMLFDWLYFQPQITCGIFADQRYGKDALICQIFTEIIALCTRNGLTVPRFVTLGNIKKPPFVAEEDMYFSFKNIPAGTRDKEVWIYCSEIETVLPAREGTAPENRLFSQLEGTMAQNHQKLFGCSKLAAKVDLNFIRGMNCKLFKFISPEKLNIEGVERDNMLTRLGKWHLPNNPDDKTYVLMAFDNQLLNVSFPLPPWWTERYSEQFRDIPMDKINECIEVYSSNGMNVSSIQTAVAQKFRKNIPATEIKEVLGLNN